MAFPSTECYSLRHRDRRKDSVDARSLSSRGSDGEAIHDVLLEKKGLASGGETSRRGREQIGKEDKIVMSVEWSTGRDTKREG